MRVLTYVFISLITCNLVAVQSCNSKKSKKGGGSTTPSSPMPTQTPDPTPATVVPPASTTPTTPVNGIGGYTCTSSSLLGMGSSDKTITIDTAQNRMQVQSGAGPVEFVLQPTSKSLFAPNSLRFVVSSSANQQSSETGHLILDNDGKTIFGRPRQNGEVAAYVTGVPYTDNGSAKTLNAKLVCHQ